MGSDLSQKQSAAENKLVGADANGNETNYAAVDANQNLHTSDVTEAGGVDTIITMTGAAIEVKVGASRLVNRKYVIMMPTGNSCKWGFSAATQSFDVFKNQLQGWPAGPNTPMWIIGPAGVTVEIGEV